MDATTYLPGAGKNEPPTLQSNAYKKEYTEFIDLAAHQLDAPLRKLSSFVEILTSKVKALSPDNDIQQYIVRIENCVGDMRSLIEGLTSLSRIISDKRECSPVKLETAVQQAVGELQHLMKESGATITIAELPEIDGDKNQLIKLFKNIIANAIKFSKKDIVPQIQIGSSSVSDEEKTLLNLPAGDQYFKIEITDNGIGFKQANAEKILLPFVRLHGISQYSGNGLGLAVCKKIVENHEGLLYAESVENSGSCFVLVLPQIVRRLC